MELTDISWSTILIGLCLFLFGIDYMSSGLKNVSQKKWQSIIMKATSSPAKSIFIGSLVTCLIQSSSATTAMTIALIRSHIMTFQQSVGIIMGANIGTTITAFIIGLNMSKYAVYFIFAGILLSFMKNRKFLSQIVFGTGCLFYGLELMSTHLQQLCQVSEIMIIIEQTLNPVLAFVIGILVTSLIQSSSAFIAIIQQLYASSALTLYLAIPFLLGSNIGTTITAILASLKGNCHEKQAALFHVLFNVTGTLIFMILLNPFYHLIIMIKLNHLMNSAMQLAVIHAFFNIVTTLIIYPWRDSLAKIIEKMIPEKYN